MKRTKKVQVNNGEYISVRLNNGVDEQGFFTGVDDDGTLFIVPCCAKIEQRVSITGGKPIGSALSFNHPSWRTENYKGGEEE